LYILSRNINPTIDINEKYQTYFFSHANSKSAVKPQILSFGSLLPCYFSGKDNNKNHKIVYVKKGRMLGRVGRRGVDRVMKTFLIGPT